MPSRLSSLLVRDGVTSVRCIERAIQDQVISGGALDTVLLEMGAVPMSELLSYLSMATGLPVAGPLEHEAADPSLAERCPSALADEHGAAPVTLEGDALRVLVCDGVSLEGLEALANEIKLAIQPVVAPEWQFRLARARVYGGDVEDRFQKLAVASESSVGATLPVDDTERVEIQPEVSEAQEPPEERLRGKRPKPEQPERRMTMELSTDSLREHLEATNAMASQAPVIQPQAESRPVEPEPAADASSYDAGGSGPLSPEVARTALSSSTDRDVTFQVFLRTLRSRLGWTALFTVQGKAAVGRLALGDSGFDTSDIRAHSISLEKSSPFKQVADSQSFYIGPPAAEDEQVLETLREVCFGELPSTLLLLPIVLRSRVVAIAAGHRFNQSFTLAEISELLPMANATADALSRLIMQSKAAGYKGGAPATQAAVVASGDIPAVDGKEGGAWKAPDGDAGAESASGDGAAAAPADSEVAGILDQIEGDDGAAETAMQEALEMGSRILPELAARFPGKLLVDRNSSEETPRAATCGPLLDLVVRLGPMTGELLAEKMRDNDKEVRYYATLCSSEVRPSGVLNELVERVFDGDRPTRAVAVEALRGYPRNELDDALDFARRALHSEDTERLRAAADALSKIADVRAIPDLLDAHSRGGDAAESARLALLALTKQDFGGSNRKWRNWWQKNAKKSRIEWMLDGLGHKSAEVRKSAADDLRTITGEYFGYHHDLPKKERDQARQRWLGWWDETGQARFLSESGGDQAAASRPARAGR